MYLKTVLWIFTVIVGQIIIFDLSFASKLLKQILEDDNPPAVDCREQWLLKESHFKTKEF